MGKLANNIWFGDSTGGTQEHQPNRLGKYTVAGSLWDNMVPFWMSETRQYITPDPNSNPILYYMKWEISESVGGLNAGTELHVPKYNLWTLFIIRRSDERCLHQRHQLPLWDSWPVEVFVHRRVVRGPHAQVLLHQDQAAVGGGTEETLNVVTLENIDFCTSQLNMTY